MQQTIRFQSEYGGRVTSVHLQPMIEFEHSESISTALPSFSPKFSRTCYLRSLKKTILLLTIVSKDVYIEI